MFRGVRLACLSDSLVTHVMFFSLLLLSSFVLADLIAGIANFVMRITSSLTPVHWVMVGMCVDLEGEQYCDTFEVRLTQL
jgi:hypothetical protein